MKKAVRAEMHPEDTGFLTRYLLGVICVAEPDTTTDKKQLQVARPASYASTMFLDGERWESWGLTGTYTYEKLNNTAARLTIRFDGSDRVLTYYMQFNRSTSGTVYEHALGEEEAYCNIFFEMQSFGISPHGGTFSMFFKGDDLRPTAAPTPK